MMIYLEKSGSSVKSAWFFCVMQTGRLQIFPTVHAINPLKSSQFANILSPHYDVEIEKSKAFHHLEFVHDHF